LFREIASGHYERMVLAWVLRQISAWFGRSGLNITNERLVSDGPLLQISAQSIATRALASMLERSAEIKNMGRDHSLRADLVWISTARK
jgi:hypothetical protein